MKIAFAGLALLTIAAPALARQPLTREMRKQQVDLLFRIADVNHDGILTRAELDAYLKATGDRNPTKAQAMFAELDPNNTGQVTLAQVEADALAKFDRADTNHDGVIEPEEREAYHAARMAAGAPAPAATPTAPAPDASPQDAPSPPPAY